MSEDLAEAKRRDALIEWLRAQIDEDERVARDALEERWAYSPPLVSYDAVPDDDGHFEMGGEEVETLGFAPEDLTHIARQDPDRTLAEVAAKRAILELHQPWTAVSAHVVPNPRCRECGDIDEYPVAWPCPTLRLLALPYAGQPGYREEWRP
jgi:hypothetical protein